MADSDVAITAGSGTKIDTRTVGAGTDEHRQVVVIGDPATAANVASADATNGLDVDVTRMAALVTGSAVIGRTGHDVTGISDGRKVVTTAGTRVTLAASTAAKWVVITAETDNTGLIVVGGTGVVASLATRQGTPLYAGDSVTLPCDDLNDINIDSTVNGDGVTFTYTT